jgi:hypothetical protein
MNRSQAFSQVATAAGYLWPRSDSAKASSSVSAASAGRPGRARWGTLPAARGARTTRHRSDGLALTGAGGFLPWPRARDELQGGA